MSFKLVILCVAVAAISCTTVHDRSDQYREQQQDFENQQQVRTAGQENQRNQNQEQFNRDRQFDNFNNDNRQHFNFRQNQFGNQGIRPFHQQQGNPTFYHLQPAFITVPTAHRNFNVQDDGHYNFGYSISDVSTGDYKSHQETRQGDKVQGQFSMIDADGFRRTVNYRADDVNGFDAEVRRDPTNFQQQQFGNNFENQQFANFNSENQNAAFFNANQPKSTTSTQVTRVEDGQQTNYATQTTNF